jgi:hypothetical protein
MEMQETWHEIRTTQRNQDADWLLLVKTIIKSSGLNTGKTKSSRHQDQAAPD